MNHEETPQAVQNILASFDETKDGYKECARIVQELSVIGWTAEYGLDAELFDLRNVREECKRLLEASHDNALTDEDFEYMDKIHSLLGLDDEVCLKMTEIEQVEFYLSKLEL